MGYFLGIDIGGTLIKAGLSRANGEEIAVAECDGETVSPQPGFSEREMEPLWRDLCQTIRQVLNLADITGDRVRGVSFSSHGKGLYAIDKKGQPVRNGIVSSDTRAGAMVVELQQQGIEAVTYPRSLQPIWNSHPAVLLRWLKQHEPAQYEAIDRVLMAHDYLRFRLTGEATAEITNISGSNLFNQQTADYDPVLMAAFGIEEVADKTAPLLGSAELAGQVTSTAAAQCGLPAGTAVDGGLLPGGVIAWRAATLFTKAAQPRRAIWPGSYGSFATTIISVMRSSTVGYKNAASSRATSHSCRTCSAPTSVAICRAG